MNKYSRASPVTYSPKTRRRGIITAEEATVSGGLGAAVASLVVEHEPVPMRILGVRGDVAPTGSAAFLLEHFGLTGDAIVDAARGLSNGGGG